MTVGEEAEMDVVLRRAKLVGESRPPPLTADANEEDEDIAELALLREWLTTWLT